MRSTFEAELRILAEYNNLLNQTTNYTVPSYNDLNLGAPPKDSTSVLDRPVKIGLPESCGPHLSWLKLEELCYFLPSHGE